MNRIVGVLLLAAMAFPGLDWAQPDAWPHTGKYGYGTRYMIFKNYLDKEVFVKVQSTVNEPMNAQFSLKPGKDTAYPLPNVWKAGRFEARTDLGFDGPYSLTEFTLGDPAIGAIDIYDVSLVDGYNIPVVINPAKGTFVKTRLNDPLQCTMSGCVSDLLKTCPPELQKKNTAGQVVACLSACAKFKTDDYCCAGAHNTPATCKPATWPVNYAAVFKKACPDAYSYAYDDQTSTFNCPPARAGAGPDYTMALGIPTATSLGQSPSRPNPFGGAVFSLAKDGSGRCALKYNLQNPGASGKGSNGGADADGLRVHLYNSEGTQILDTRVSELSGSIALPDLEPGTYLLSLKSAKGFVSRRIAYGIK